MYGSLLAFRNKGCRNMSYHKIMSVFEENSKLRDIVVYLTDLLILQSAKGSWAIFFSRAGRDLPASVYVHAGMLTIKCWLADSLEKPE